MRKRFEMVWAIRAEAIPTVARIMTRELGSTTTPGPEAAAGAGAWEAALPSTRGPQGNKVAIVPIQGVLTQDGPRYYGSNYQGITEAVEQAAADPDVKSIILSVDSPGGQVTGLPECASTIAAAAKAKPVHAIVEGAAASAAYWLTSQASDITVTPSGEVGSVGVRMMHVDLSEALDKEGIKVTELHSGDFKTEWSPYQPLSDEAKENMTGRIQDSHADFLADIAKGRGARATAAVKKNRFGEGRMFDAETAAKNGMVDRVQPTREFYRRAIPATRTAPVSAARARLALEQVRF